MARLLIVDDDPVNRRILEHMLNDWGLQVTVAESVDAALAAVRAGQQSATPIQLMLLDGAMPGTDGFALLDQVRQQTELALPATVVLSSADHSGELQRASELGAAACLLKPVKPSDLQEAILKIRGVAIPRKEAPPAEPQVEEQLGHLRILVVEDEAMVAALLVVAVVLVRRAVLRVLMPTPRCSMVTQPNGAEGKDPGVLRAIVRDAAQNLGVYAEVVEPGDVREGDEAVLLDT